MDFSPHPVDAPWLASLDLLTTNEIVGLNKLTFGHHASGKRGSTPEPGHLAMRKGRMSRNIGVI